MYLHHVAEPQHKFVPEAGQLLCTYGMLPQPTDINLQFFAEVKHPPPVWSISHETFDAMMEQNGLLELFIEIGTFIGNGVIEVDRNMKRRGASCPILTVDNFAGTIGIDDLLSDIAVRPRFLEYFDPIVLAAFLRHRKLKDAFLVNLPARDFFRRFYYKGFQASHIYLDASHEYLDTYEEMRLAWECLPEGGVLGGDDYNWETVKAAVDRFCCERRLACRITQGQTNNGITALQWVIAAKKSSLRHDDARHRIDYAFKGRTICEYKEIIPNSKIRSKFL
jgi:hypothetical protein